MSPCEHFIIGAGWSDLMFMYVRGDYDKFPDLSRMGTLIDSTHMKL